MPFTVTRPGGMTDAEFAAYRIALAREGCDLARLARTLDPADGRRWLAAWDDAAVAGRFAPLLAEEVGGADWQVVEVDSTSEGPLGPLVVQYHFDGTGLVFVLDDVTEAMLRAAYPDRVPIATYLTLEQDGWDRYRQRGGGLHDLVREILPVLTALAPDDLDPLGVLVLDADSDKTLLSVPPSGATVQV